MEDVDCENPVPDRIEGVISAKAAFYTRFIQPLNSIHRARGINSVGYLNWSASNESPATSAPTPDFQWRPEGTPVGKATGPGALADLNSTCVTKAYGLSPDVTRAVNQVFTCMNSCQSWTGFISGSESIVLCQRLPQQPNAVQVSEPIAFDAQNPTVLHALQYLVHTEREMQRTYGKPPRSSNPKMILSPEAADVQAVD